MQSDPLAKAAALQAEAEERAAARRAEREKVAQENRRRYPEIARFVDELREAGFTFSVAGIHEGRYEVPAGFSSIVWK